MLARLKEDADSLVMPGVPSDERDMLVESQPKVFYFTDDYRDYPMVLIRLSKAKRATVEPLLRTALADAGVEEGGCVDGSVGSDFAAARMNNDEFLAAALCSIPPIRSSSMNYSVSRLPDAWIVSGCSRVQTVWNVLHRSRVDYGISDYDVFYFDPDTSWRPKTE